MFQFYNSEIKKEVAKLETIISEIKINIQVSTDKAFIEYMKTGRLISLDEFKKQIDIDIWPFVAESKRIIEEQQKNNREKFEKQMKNHNKEQIHYFESKEAELDKIRYGFEVMKNSFYEEAYANYNELVRRINDVL